MIPFPPHLELHNIAELDEDSGYPGPLVRRIPRKVSEGLINGALAAENCVLSEIRFVVKSGRRLAVVLTSLEGADLLIYRGDFLQNHIRLPAGQAVRHILDFENNPFLRYRQEVFTPRNFHPDVWRIVLDGPMLFHGIDCMGCEVRSPLLSEKPLRRWLAYGSSITHGFTPVTRMQSYVAQTARRLGVDVLNMALSGSCQCEPSFADYLASRDDWEFVTAEIGVNMRATVSPEEFARRVRYFVATLVERRRGKPVVLITPFRSGSDFLAEPDQAHHRTRAYEKTLRDVTHEFSAHAVHLVEGHEILNAFTGLTMDFIHPSTEGHTLMAENLAAALRGLGIVKP